MSLSGCMTVVGAVTSPFTTTVQVFGAIDEERQINRWNALTTAGGAVIYVLAIPAVMLVPPMIGLEKDVDFMTTFSYTTSGTKRLSMLFMPWKLIGSHGVPDLYDVTPEPTRWGEVGSSGRAADSGARGLHSE
jgi:hypothetical protein